MSHRAPKPSYFSARLRAARVAVRLKQAALADSARCSKSHLSNIEAGRRGASRALKARLAESLKLAPAAEPTP